jgi:hypothetical protein
MVIFLVRGLRLIALFLDQLLHHPEPLIDNSWGKKEEMTDFTLISYSTALHALN